MIKKVLVANRGEIAVRIIRACREMGIRSVAVHSEADGEALHVKEADEAVLIGPPPSVESYLKVDALIAAARSTGADAIHPGYGFLAENSGFARRVEEEQLTFIGPSSEAIRKMGDKLMARKIAAEADVPLVPGQTLAATDPVEAAAAADALGYPVIVKAAGGGGGKGMRIVRTPAALPDAMQEASREARSSFSDPRVYLEKYFDRPRHVEIQVFADSAGNVVHLFERECSVQRRHQKIIEESPSTALTPELRARMGEAAVKVARAVEYRGAGTVEFLLVPGPRFYFLEMNTRIQVEHPVTEMVTGVDLVALQLEVASGEPLPFTQADLCQSGHSIECRLYAEDPASGFLPSPGRIHYMRAPVGPWVRFDTGVESGSVVPIHYDPILAKLIVWARDRERAIARMDQALKETVILGIKSPITYMRKVLRHRAFVAGDLHTEFLKEHDIDPTEEGDLDLALAAAVLWKARAGGPADSGPSRSELASPWQTLGRWELGGMR
ncbi:MAG: acetyl-CoA carboxylase biotin carboxylase subunit [Candidatus Riflebacteria bacterium]|nr:acetyl-CoA carboxylase biotin carboxylase subunit [Candidatus Riflebacteria bacterium]